MLAKKPKRMHKTMTPPTPALHPFPPGLWHDILSQWGEGGWRGAGGKPGMGEGGKEVEWGRKAGGNGGGQPS